MSVLNLAITTGRPDTYLQSNFETPGGQHAIAQRIVNYLNSVQTGSERAASAGSPPSIAISIPTNGTQANGAFNFGGPPNPGDAVIINGVQFNAVASGATGNEFNIGVDGPATAINFAEAINASTSNLIKYYVTAKAFGLSVSIVSKFYGVAGNMCSTEIFVNVSNMITVGQARLTNGSPDPAAQTLSF